jgi:hypothetical protein
MPVQSVPVGSGGAERMSCGTPQRLRSYLVGKFGFVHLGLLVVMMPAIYIGLKLGTFRRLGWEVTTSSRQMSVHSGSMIFSLPGFVCQSGGFSRRKRMSITFVE